MSKVRTQSLAVIAATVSMTVSMLGAGCAASDSANRGGTGGGTAPATGGATRSGGMSGSSGGASGGTAAGGTASGGTASGGAGGSGGASGSQGGSTSGDAALAPDGPAHDSRADSRDGRTEDAADAPGTDAADVSIGDGGDAAPTGGSGGGTGAGGNATGGATGTSSTGGRDGGGATGTGGTPNLHEKYADYFPIGAAVDTTNYNSAVFTQHFGSLTAEDQMKFDALEPNEGSFSYGTADQMVNFAVSRNMKVRGHTLVWHRQNPSWLFANATKDRLLSRMRNHITNVVKHFKGKVYAWDVVNEAIMEDGDYRKGDETKEDQRSQWYQIAGPDYIAEAFKAAAAADPDAKLFYNDYYDWLPAKHQGIHKMLKGLLDAGVPVHGVGMQCHINIEPSTDPSHQGYYQTVANLEEAIKLYASLGLEVQVTELDLSLYVPGVTYTSDQFYTAATFTPALQQKQADRYREFFELFRTYKEVITGVTFWGISDDNTWLSELSSGRKDFPLLFDGNKQPKKAFFAIVDF